MKNCYLHACKLSILICIIFKGLIASSFAATITVDSHYLGAPVPADGSCTLREAVINANSDLDFSGGDCMAGFGSDLILVPEGTFNFPDPTEVEYISPNYGYEDASKNDLDILDNVTISGAGKGSTVLNGGDVSGIFQFPVGGVSATIQDLTIANAGTGGPIADSETAILINATSSTVSLTLSKVEIRGGIHSTAAIVLRNNTDVNLKVVNSEFVRNVYHPIYAVAWSGSLLIDSSTVRGNKKPVFVSNSSFGHPSLEFHTRNKNVTIANSTFSGALGNFESTSALYLRNPTLNPISVGIYNSTFNNNDANTQYGYTIFSTGRGIQLEMANTVIANSNRRYGGSDCLFSHPSGFTDLGNNLVEDGSCITNTTSFSGDPLFSSLSEFGGETHTHGLLEGSPALDSGSNAFCNAAPVFGLDQRGTSREQGASCDIGAFEGTVANPPPLPAATIEVNNLSDTVMAGDALCTLREAVINANTNSDRSGGDCIAGSADDLIILPSGTMNFSAPTEVESIIPGSGNEDASINDVDILDDVTIRGAGKGITVLDGADFSGVFQFSVGGITASIEDLTITNAGENSSLNRNESAIKINAASGEPLNLSLSGIEILNGDTGQTRRGAIDIGGYANVDLKVVDSELVNNGDHPIYAYLWRGSISISTTTIRNNARPVYIHNQGRLSSSKSVEIANSTFSSALSDYKPDLYSARYHAQASSIVFDGSALGYPMLVGIYNSTFNDNDTNTASGGPSLYMHGATEGGTFEMANTIIANSNNRGISTFSCKTNASSFFTDLGNNWVEDGACISANSSLSGDPELDSLAENGGTTLSYAPLAGSGLIGAGDVGVCAVTPVLNVDQRNVNRLEDGYCDIGSIEFVSTNSAPVAVDDVAIVLGTTPFEIDVLVNDNDSDGTLNAGSVVVVVSPNNGHVSVNPQGGAITYTHDGSSVAQDSFTYTVLDNEGAESNEALVSLTIELQDTINPITNITVPSMNQWLAPGTQLSGTAVDEVGGSGIASVQVALYDLTNSQWVDANGNPSASGGWITQYATVSGGGENESWTYDLGSDLALGSTYRFYAVAVDQQGNSESFSYLDAVMFTVSTSEPDTINPITNITVPSMNQWLAPGTQLSGTAVDEVGGSGIASVQVALYDLTNSQWVDANGNPSASGGWITQYATVSGGGENESWTYDLGSDLALGSTYRFYAVAVDQQGNSESFSYLDAVMFTVSTSEPDTINPITNITVPSMNQWLAPGTQLSGTAVDEVGGSGIASVQVALYDLTNNQWVDANGNPSASGGWITQYATVSGGGENESWTYDLGSDLALGSTYRFYAVAVDQQGNSESFSYLDAVMFTVSTSEPDTINPITNITVPSMNQWLAPGTQLSGTAVDEVGGSGIASVQVALYDLTNNQWVDANGNPSASGGWITQYATVSGGGENESWTYDLGSDLALGSTYRFYAVAVDQQGNSESFSYLDAVMFTVR